MLKLRQNGFTYKLLQKHYSPPAGSLTKNFPFGFMTLAISAKISVLWMYVDGERRPDIATSNEDFGCAAKKIR